MKSKFIKGLTLGSFIILMGGFVAYRSGVFSEKNHETTVSILKTKLLLNENLTAIDSPTVKKKVTDPTMMSTLKSLILLDDDLKIKPADSLDIKLTKQKKKQEEDSLLLKKIMMMASSKSAVIFTPEQSADTPKKNEIVPKFFLQEKQIMSSSKSVILAPGILTFTDVVPPKKK